MPRGLAILLPYLALLGSLGLLGFLVIPPVISEVSALSTNLPRYVDGIQKTLSIMDSWLQENGVPSPVGQQTAQISQALQQAALLLIRLPILALNAVLGVFAVLAIGFYWLLSRDASVDWIARVVRPNDPQRIRRVFDRAESQMGSYVRGLIFLSLVIGGVTLVGLLVLRLPYAIVLSVVAGVLEMLPTIGPILSAVPAVLIALSYSPLLAVGVALLYLGIQQLENYILVPRVHQQSVGLPPLIILLAVFIGSTVGGIVGAILAVPVAALLSLLIDELRGKQSA
jgi:predicted PurR-regulated permease PerM